MVNSDELKLTRRASASIANPSALLLRLSFRLRNLFVRRPSVAERVLAVPAVRGAWR